METFDEQAATQHVVVHNKGNGCIIALLCLIALPVVLWIIGSIVFAAYIANEAAIGTQ